MQEDGWEIFPRLRSIDQCYYYIKEQDPDTAITKNAIRKMASNGDVSVRWCGRKLLIYLDDLLSILQQPQESRGKEESMDDPDEIGKIRKLNI